MKNIWTTAPMPTPAWVFASAVVGKVAGTMTPSGALVYNDVQVYQP